MTGSEEDSLAMVGFQAGGLRFAIEASRVASMLSAGSEAEAFSKLMGLHPSPARTRVLVVRQGESMRAVEVEEPVSNFRLPFQAVQPLPAMVAARSDIPCIKALAWDEAGLIILADLNALQPE